MLGVCCDLLIRKSLWSNSQLPKPIRDTEHTHASRGVSDESQQRQKRAPTTCTTGCLTAAASANVRMLRSATFFSLRRSTQAQQGAADAPPPTSALLYLASVPNTRHCVVAKMRKNAHANTNSGAPNRQCLCRQCAERRARRPVRRIHAPMRKRQREREAVATHSPFATPCRAARSNPRTSCPQRTVDARSLSENDKGKTNKQTTQTHSLTCNFALQIVPPRHGPPSVPCAASTTMRGATPAGAPRRESRQTRRRRASAQS